MKIESGSLASTIASQLRRALICCAAGFIALPAAGQDRGPVADLSSPISLRDTFPVGSNALCEAQILDPEQGSGLFDRRYSIICRDAAAPIGTLWVVRGSFSDDAAQRFGQGEAACSSDEAGAPPEIVADRLRDVRRLRCEGGLQTELLVGERGGRTYAARGLSAYDTALALGLATLAENRPVAGDVAIPLTQTTDALAFARQQAETISSDQALVEGYRRSNNGEFAEAAEFFAASAEALTGNSAIEARLNEGLLQSNLGNFAEASRLFEITRPRSEPDPVLARLQRNYEALDALNRQDPTAAITILDTPIASEFIDTNALRELRIGPALASRLTAENERASRSGVVMALTPLERRQLLDGQADYLRAEALGRSGMTDEATAALLKANSSLAGVREGRVASILWLRAQVLSELAEIAERTARPAEAESLHMQGIALLEANYPGSPVYQSARAQLAGFYARNGRGEAAKQLYRSIVSRAQGLSSPSLRGLMVPYFSLLLDESSGDEAAADMFLASQLLQRPGLAQTQAVLARELSGGDDEAALLFRKTTNLGRSIEQLRRSIAQIRPISQTSAEAAKVLAERELRLEQLQVQQAEILQQLSTYPRYKAVSDSALDLAGLQSILREDEAYVKLVTIADDSFVVYTTANEARAYRADLSPQQLETIVQRIRESIALAEGGEVLTFPFDIESSRSLYTGLFGPIAELLPRHRHIIFEPDGAMLKLPINLLVIDDASVERYNARMQQIERDEYDFTGTAWLGRTAQISTSVSPAAFRDVRASRPSNGTAAYLGLGQNAPASAEMFIRTRTRAVTQGGEKCTWSPGIWAQPVRADELYDAASKLGAGSEVITGAQFTDTAIKAREDLTQYRILHFATHGLVTAPQPECPPRPALLTSFGDSNSDGLLSFAEIFELRIDANLVILSACDTAGGATVGATREAGVTSGGDYALDGLVRAFVGAGGRTVLASHWPVPDDFNATTRLIGGLFAADNGASAPGAEGQQTADALRVSQLGLMDDPQTSHPFYWSAFAVIGDGAIPLAR